MARLWCRVTHPLRRNWRRGALLLVSVVAGHLALIVHPQPLFAHSLQRGNVVLYARAPLPPEAVPILDDAVRRISRSPLYDPARTHHVFLCDTPTLYGFFTLWKQRSGGVTDTWAWGNAFIRPTNIAHNAVIGASGVEKAAPRTLAYYLAHEVSHAMTADHTGRVAFRSLAAFQKEGYADYVGFAEPVDLAKGRADFIAGTADMDPQKSGHYDRYRLLVGYLLQERRMSVDDLLAKRLDQSQIERELLTARLNR